MARYNTAPQTLTVTGAQTFTYAFTGGIISLTGTAGYTVTMASPVFFPGSRQTFYNATNGNITLETPSGNITGNGVTLGTTVTIPTNSTYQLTSDGTNYVLTSALAGTTVFELPVTFNNTLNADAKVELNPSDANVEIKPTGTGLVDISPGSSVAIQPGGTATIRPTGNAELSSASGTLSIGDAGQTTTIKGNISATTNAQTISLSPGTTGTVTIQPNANCTIGAGGTLSISSTTAGSISNMNIGATNPGTGAFTTLGASGTVSLSSSTDSSSTGSGAVIVSGGMGVAKKLYAANFEGPIGANSANTGAFTTLSASGVTSITNSTASTNTTTGALKVTGGVGVQGAIYAGSIQAPIGNVTANSGAFSSLTASGATTFTANTASTTTATGSVVITGGLGVSGQVTAGTLSGNHSGGSGSFTTLTASSTVTLSPGANVTLSPTGTGTVTMSPAGGGSINNMSIGATTASSGAFSTLGATSTVTLSSTTDSSSSTTGAVQISGGLGVAKKIYSGSGFYGNVVGGSLSGTTISGSDTTDSTSTTTGALKTAGGLGVAKALNVGTDGTFGSTSRGANTVVRSLAGDSYRCGFEAYGNSQGTGYVYVGQSSSYGGGMMYNGDGSPAFATNEGSDYICFYRNASGTKTVTAKYSYNDNNWIYYGHIRPSGSSNDLGTSSARWRNIYTNDLQLSNGIGDYTIVEGEEDLFLYNNKNGKTYKFLVEEVDPSIVPPKAETDD